MLETSRKEGAFWLADQRSFGFALPQDQYVTLKRAAQEVVWESFAWEMVDEIEAAICLTRTDTNGYRRFSVPGRLFSSLTKALTRAKDTCAPRLSICFVRLLEQIERCNESRSAIDRLGDLGA